MYRERQTCSCINGVECPDTDKTEGSESCGFPSALLRLPALTHLSFGVKHRSSQQAGFKFDELPAQLFHKLHSLQYLQVFSCGVVQLPADVSLLTGGQHQCSWTLHRPCARKHHLQLQNLNLPCPAGLETLSILSATALGLPQLQLPPEISSCTALTSLQLSCAAIPPPVWQLPLRELTLDQAPLSGAELQHFTRLAALQSLRLCNRFYGGDEALDADAELRHLAVSSSLTCLRLDGNIIDDLPIFQALGQLRELDLKHNRCHIADQCTTLFLPFWVRVPT